MHAGRMFVFPVIVNGFTNGGKDVLQRRRIRATGVHCVLERLQNSDVFGFSIWPLRRRFSSGNISGRETMRGFSAAAMPCFHPAWHGQETIFVLLYVAGKTADSHVPVHRAHHDHLADGKKWLSVSNAWMRRRGAPPPLRPPPCAQRSPLTRDTMPVR